MIWLGAVYRIPSCLVCGDQEPIWDRITFHLYEDECLVGWISTCGGSEEEYRLLAWSCTLVQVLDPIDGKPIHQSPNPLTGVPTGLVLIFGRLLKMASGSSRSLFISSSARSSVVSPSSSTEGK